MENDEGHMQPTDYEVVHSLSYRISSIIGNGRNTKISSSAPKAEPTHITTNVLNFNSEIILAFLIACHITIGFPTSTQSEILSRQL